MMQLRDHADDFGTNTGFGLGRDDNRYRVANRLKKGLKEEDGKGGRRAGDGG